MRSKKPEARAALLHHRRDCAESGYRATAPHGLLARWTRGDEEWAFTLVLGRAGMLSKTEGRHRLPAELRNPAPRVRRRLCPCAGN